MAVTRSAAQPFVVYAVSRLLRSSISILIFAFICIYFAVTVPYFYQRIFHLKYNAMTLSSEFFLIGFTFIFYASLPLVAAQTVFQETPRALGLQLPQQRKTTLLLSLLTISIAIPIAIFCANQSSFRAYYNFHGMEFSKFIFIQLVILPIYYFCEEFFYRGFLFLSLWRRLGWHSFWITDIIFVIVHFSKPGIEILLSIPVSIILNFVTLKSRSILPAYIIHISIGILINCLVNYT